MSETSAGELERTPLYDLHVELGGKMVPFAGYALPVQFPLGILGEHLHTRAQAGLFDVSHMGQVLIRGEDPAAAFETLVPGDIVGLAPGAMRYTLFTDENGGILDDLMATRRGEDLFVVVNAACKADDLAHMRAGLDGRCTVELLADRALMALQGPAAAAVLARHAPASAELAFMTGAAMEVAGAACFVTRSGYTGEDGFELSVPAAAAEKLARTLLAEEEVAPVGLGARDSLRLEAGLCLYGHDIDTATTPIEASLAWTIPARRRAEANFPGAEVILRQLAEGTARRRVGILPEGRAPAREHSEIVDGSGAHLGEVTSGTFGPSLGGPCAMGYVDTAHAKVGSEIGVVVRGRVHAARVAKMPFVTKRYHG